MTCFEGDRSIEEGDIRAYGYSRDGRFDRRQIAIGVVMTGDGIPLCHHVFPGNTVDKTTVSEVIRDLKERFALRRVIFVGDRGMLSDENLEAVLDHELGFIVAHPLRRNKVAAEVIGELGKEFDRQSEKEQFLSDERNFLRFALAYSPAIASDARKNREERLAGADAFIREVLVNQLVTPTRCQTCGTDGPGLCATLGHHRHGWQSFDSSDFFRSGGVAYVIKIPG